MTCCINDANDPAYKACSETNDDPASAKPKQGNQPSATPGDPYGTNGPLPPGTYWIIPIRGRFGINYPGVTDDPDVPNRITTPNGTVRDDILFHNQRRYSNGCITCVDHGFDDEVLKKTREAGGRMPMSITDAWCCP